MRILKGLALAAAMVAMPALAAPPEPAPPELAPLEAYGRLPAMSHVTLSPSGERLAFVAFDGKGRKLFARDLAGKPLAVMDLADAKLRDIYWAGDRFVLISISRPERLSLGMNLSEQYTVFVLDTQTAKVSQIFAKGVKSWDVVYGELGVREVGGRWYGYFTTLQQKRLLTGEVEFEDYDPDVYRVDLESGELDLINRGAGDTTDWLIVDGAVAARFGYSSSNGDWALTAGEGGRVLASGNAPLGDVGVAGRGKTPGTAVLWVQEEGLPALREINLADGTAKPAIDGGQPVAWPVFDRQQGLLIGYAAEAVTPRVVYFDPGRQAKADKAGRAFAGKRPIVISASQDQDRMVLMTDGGDDSGSFWLVDLKANKADPLGEAYPRIVPSKVGPAKLIRYKAADGLEIEAVLTLPPGREAKGLPVIVMPHGGPQAHDDPGFNWMAQAFASRGYAVLQPNFRGSDGYGRAFRDKGFGQWGRAMQTDLSDGLAFLAAEGIVDPKRACIVGGSYGGYAALAGVTVQNGVYRCAAAFAGVFDLNAMLADTRPRSSTMRYWKAFMGGGLNDIAPIAKAGRADAPVLLIHGKTDVIVPVEQTTAMAGALRRAGKPVEVVLLDGGDHWLTDEASRIAMLRSTMAFVLKHNPPQ